MSGTRSRDFALLTQTSGGSGSGGLPTGLWRRLESRGTLRPSRGVRERSSRRRRGLPPQPPSPTGGGRGQLHPLPAWTGSAGSRISSPGPRAASPRKLCRLCGGGSASPAAPGAGECGNAARDPAPPAERRAVK